MEQWLIKLADDELKLVTSDELLQMEKTAEEFDGFYGWQVLGKLNKHDVSNSVCKRKYHYKCFESHQKCDNKDCGIGYVQTDC